MIETKLCTSYVTLNTLTSFYCFVLLFPFRRKLKSAQKKISMKSSCALITWEEMVISPRARSFLPRQDLARGEITISSRVTSAHDDFTGKNLKRYRNLSMAIAFIDSYRNTIFLFYTRLGCGH